MALNATSGSGTFQTLHRRNERGWRIFFFARSGCVPMR